MRTTLNKRPSRPKFSEYIFQWAARFSLACFFIGAALTPLVLELLARPYTFYKVFVLSGLVFGSIGAAWALWDRANRFDDIYIESLHSEPVAEIKPMPEKEPVQEYSVKLESLRIWQPEPGAFASWVRVAIDEKNKIQFSENQALKRGWTSDQYRILVAQLKMLGILDLHNERNNAPVLTDNGKSQLREWCINV